jgi:hypothetical protein
LLPKEPKISKQAVAGTTRDMIIIILETIEIIRKPGRTTSKRIILAAHKIGLLTTEGRKKHKEKTSCKNLCQYRYCLIIGKLNNPAPLQCCRCQITEIILYMQLKLVQPL